MRQANFSSIFSGTFDIWTRNFFTFFLVYLVFALVIGALSLGASYAFFGIPYVSAGFLGTTGTLPSSAAILTYVAYELVVGIIGWIVGSAIVGGVTDFSIRKFRGENVRIMESLNRGFQRLLSILGANLLVSVLTIGVILLWAVVLILGAVSLGTAGATGGALALLCGSLIALPFVFVLVLYLVLALCLYVPAIMMEGTHAIDSLGRSWSLTKGHKWSILWAGIVVGIISAIITGAIGFVAGFTGNPIVQLIAVALGTAITGAWFAILTSVAYDLIVKQPQPTAWPPTYAPGYPPR